MESAIIAGIVSLVVAVIGGFITTYVAKRQSYNQYTTHQRNEWLKELRTFSNEFLSLLWCLQNKKGIECNCIKTDCSENNQKSVNCIVERLNHLKYEIISRLNAKVIFQNQSEKPNEFDEKIYKLMKKNYSTINIKELQKNFALMFKVEWEKVKQESKAGFFNNLLVKVLLCGVVLAVIFTIDTYIGHEYFRKTFNFYEIYNMLIIIFMIVINFISIIVIIYGTFCLKEKIKNKKQEINNEVQTNVYPENINVEVTEIDSEENEKVTRKFLLNVDKRIINKNNKEDKDGKTNNDD